MLLEDSFLFFKVCAHVCLLVRMCMCVQVPMLSNVGVGNWIQVLWKTIMCSFPLSHLSSPQMKCLKNWFNNSNNNKLANSYWTVSHVSFSLTIPWKNCSQNWRWNMPHILIISLMIISLSSSSSPPTSI